LHEPQTILQTLGGAVPLSFAAAMSADAPPAFHARRAVTEYIGEIPYPPEAVFPLLCPVREYEWLKGWSCEMVHSASGVAEENCIFKTPQWNSTWNVDHYEPAKRIAFTVISPEQVSRLNISLARTASGGTRLTWNRMNTGLNEAGNAKAGSWDTERDKWLTNAITHFLKTGKMAED
jgi:hypothetical protein